MKLYTITLCLLAQVLLINTVVHAQREQEPNNNFQEANVFQLDGVEFAGQLYSSSDVDVFRFNVTTPGVLSFAVRPENNNYDGGAVGVSIKNGNEQILAYRKIGSDSNTKLVRANITAPGYYYLVVAQAESVRVFTKDYIVTPTIDTSSSAIDTREIERNDNFQEANVFQLDGVEFAGQLYSSSDVDVFRFNVTSPGVLSFAVRPENNNYDGGAVGVSIYNSFSDELVTRKVRSDSDNVVSCGTLSPGYYYLVISQYYDYVDGYNIRTFDKDYIINGSINSELNYEIEPENNLCGVNRIYDAVSYTGIVFNYEDKDCFSFYIGIGGSVDINIAPIFSYYDGGSIQAIALR